MINSFLLGPLFSIYFILPTFIFLIFLPLVILVREFYKKKEDILSLAAHELRSSLTVIQGFAEILSSENLSEDKKIKVIQKIHQSSIDMSSILDSLLLLGKKTRLPLERYPLGNFLEKVALEFRKKYPNKLLHIRNDLSKQDLKIHKDLFFLALFNLLDNAAKHGGSPIILRVTQDRKQIIFSVEDQGKGVPFNQLSKIFNKGFCSGESKGHGLGLYIVKKVMEKHKGSASVEQNELKSSVFKIMLKK